MRGVVGRMSSPGYVSLYITCDESENYTLNQFGIYKNNVWTVPNQCDTWIQSMFINNFSYELYKYYVKEGGAILSQREPND